MSIDIASGLAALLHDHRDGLVSRLLEARRFTAAVSGPDAAQLCCERVDLLLSFIGPSSLERVEPGAAWSTGECFGVSREHALRAAFAGWRPRERWYFTRDCERVFRNCVMEHWRDDDSLARAAEAVQDFFERVDATLSKLPPVDADPEGALVVGSLGEVDQFLRIVLDHAPALVVVRDSDGRTLLANRRYEALPAQPPEALHAQRESEQQALRAGESIEVEETFVDGQGTSRTYLSIKFPMFHDGFEPYATCAISTDITERKHIEAELRGRLVELGALNRRLEAAQNQLLQSEKMASIGQLAAGIAHELNNPISFVHSNFGSLKAYVADLFAVLDAYEDVTGSAEAASCPAIGTVARLKQACDLEFLRTDIDALMEESRDGLSRVRKIIQDLKDFSHVAETDWQWADLHRGLDSTLNIVHNELKYKAQIVKEYGDLPEIYCVLSQLNQVFMNILVNAAHAIVEQGTITVRTGCDDASVWVEISDTGRGIAPEHISRIFDPFFTTKPVGQGTGLGLSLSYSIVRKHGGHIRVSSQPGTGSTFRVELPVDLEDQRGQEA